MKILKSFPALCLVLVSLTGCFEEVATKGSSSLSSTESGPVSEITPSDFNGATDAKNLVTGIQVGWVLSVKEAANYRIYRVSGKRLNLIGTVGGNVNSFIDGNISYGTIYAYIVRAVDSKDVEDANSKQVSALAWGGISTIVANSRSSLDITFVSASPVADAVNIYIKPVGGTATKTLIKAVTGSDTNVQLTGLKPGFKYEVSAQAYVNTLKKEDGNLVTFEVSTLTEGYHFDTGLSDAPHWMSVVNVRAFGDSPATEPHPGDLEKQPSTRQVELYFNSFRGMAPSTKYVVVRTADDGRPIDTQNGSAAACTTTTLSSCLPSNPTPCKFTTSGGVLKCIDKDVAVSPAKYRYTLAMFQTDGTEEWVEPFPMDLVDEFSLRVQIPPERMVLVHRDAVNNEMCQIMNKSSDPTNHNRCQYNGVGDRPYSSGHSKPPLNLTAGYYDFGYNLFVDRYNLGCNWTMAPQGKCGAGATDGDCIGTVANQYSGTTYPNNAIGAEGNVFVMFNYTPGGYSSSNCYIKIAGQWKSPQQVVASYPNPQQYLTKMLTTDPSLNNKKIPPINNSYFTLWPMGANVGCNSFVDPDYGPKRIPRMREYRAYSAFPSASILNEPFAASYSKFYSWVNQVSIRNNANGYGCMNRQGVAEALPTSISAMLAASNQIAMMNIGGQRYGHGSFLGTNYTADCQSRYGVNDMMTPRVVSDYFYYYATMSPKRLIGGVSPIDNGNRDLLKDVSSGLETGLRIDMTNFQSNTSDYYTSLAGNPAQNYVALPLGLPIFLSTSTDYLSRPLFIENISAVLTPTSVATASDRSYVLSVSNRWSMYSAGMGTWESGNGGAENWYDNRLQCVLPAE